MRPRELYAQTPGSLDPSFGSSGKVTTSFGATSAVANAVAVQADGKIVVVGQTWIPAVASSGDFAVARYDAEGTLDAAFGTAGKVTTDFEGLDDGATEVAIQPDGKIVDDRTH